MTSGFRSCTLGAVLTELGSSAQMLGGGETSLLRSVSGATVWSGSGPPGDGTETALVCPAVDSDEELVALLTGIPASPARIVILTAPSPMPDDRVRRLAGDHTVVGVQRPIDPADVVLAIARATQSPDVAMSNRLAAVQRSLTTVLLDPDPVAALMSKLTSMCNATVALFDNRGGVVRSTGPLPIKLLMAEVARTSADSQMLDIDGWRGIADRVKDAIGEHQGWLVVTARRPAFPDVYSSAAIHVATTLVEASYRMDAMTRAQERAVRAAVLDEALALERRPTDPELAGRIASFGLSFDDELRVVVCQPTRRMVAHRGPSAAPQWHETVSRMLTREGIPYLLSVRDACAIIMVQCSPGRFKRLFIAEGDRIPPARVGVGRNVAAVGDVADSYNDAQMAVRALNGGPESRFVSYEEFDLATRLFADVGIDRMLAWAEDFLRPLDERGPIFESLQVYFDCSLNINTAADALSIHHNSLRYRLAKAEELLHLSLREPAAISSVFLALKARDVGKVHAVRAQAARRVNAKRPSDVDAPTPTDFNRPPVRRHGVVRGPGE